MSGLAEENATAAIRETVHAEDRGDGVYQLTLSRPDRRNALNAQTAADLRAHLGAAVAAGAKLITLAGEGPVFCAGADLKERDAGAVEDTLHTVASSPIPWVAVVDGPAVGAGVALMAVCAFSVMSAEAWVSLPEINTIGRFPVGVSRWLSRFCGMRQLMQIAVDGQRLPADRAVALGWAGATGAVDTGQRLGADLVERLSGLPAEVLAQSQQAWRNWLAVPPGEAGA